MKAAKTKAAEAINIDPMAQRVCDMFARSGLTTDESLVVLLNVLAALVASRKPDIRQQYAQDTIAMLERLIPQHIEFLDSNIDQLKRMILREDTKP